MNTVEITNAVRVCGEITEEPAFSHEILGESFFTMTVRVRRLSGNADDIPVQVSDRLTNIEELVSGRKVQITGSYRSYNKHNENGSSNLILFMFADEIADITEGEEDVNEVILEGFLCKPPVYRKTPLGREICDLLIAVNRAYGKSDYIPCIAWGRNACYASGLEVGSRLKCEGRIQSRIYLKDNEERTAYEVSLTSIRLLD